MLQLICTRRALAGGLPELPGAPVPVLALVLCWQAFHEEYSRLYLLSKETPTPQNDARLQHVLIYFLQNNAPQQVVERTLLEQFADKNLSYDERFVPRFRGEAFPGASLF